MAIGDLYWRKGNSPGSQLLTTTPTKYAWLDGFYGISPGEWLVELTLGADARGGDVLAHLYVEGVQSTGGVAYMDAGQGTVHQFWNVSVPVGQCYDIEFKLSTISGGGRAFSGPATGFTILGVDDKGGAPPCR